MHYLNFPWYGAYFVQVWEFDQAHRRWLPVAELALPEDKGDQVYAVAWAPNIGRLNLHNFSIVSITSISYTTLHSIAVGIKMLNCCADKSWLTLALFSYGIKEM